MAASYLTATIALSDITTQTSHVRGDDSTGFAVIEKLSFHLSSGNHKGTAIGKTEKGVLNNGGDLSYKKLRTFSKKVTPATCLGSQKSAVVGIKTFDASRGLQFLSFGNSGELSVAAFKEGKPYCVVGGNSIERVAGKGHQANNS